MPRVSPDYIPKLHLHKASGQAVVRLDYQDHYLGKFGTEDAKARYFDLIAKWLRNGRRLPDSLPRTTPLPKPEAVSVNTLADAFMRYAETYYARPGKRTDGSAVYKLVLADVKDMFGESPAEEFTPSKLKAVRDRWISRGYVRTSINRYCNLLRQVFRWGVEEEIVPAGVVHALECVRPLSKGRTEARESTPVRPVAPHHIEAIKPFVSRQVWALVQLQLHAGGRGDELFRLTRADINTSDSQWCYKPASHKTASSGVDRAIWFGPHCQAVLAPFFEGRAPDAPLFSPREANAEMQAARATKGKPRRPDQRPNKRKSARVIREIYDDASYRRAIQRACEKARIPKWHPHQLLHNFSTEVRRRHGIEAARAARGHTSIDTTLIYAERDSEIGRKIAAEIG